MHRVDLLGCPMDAGTMTETIDRVHTAISEGKYLQHSVVNVAKLVNMRSDPALDTAVRSCDLISVDGMGLIYGARFLGEDIGERVTGIDLFHELVAMSAGMGFPVFLLGGTDEVVTLTARRLQEQYPLLRIVGAENGYFWGEEEAVVERIRASGARMLFVAISSPQKETFIARWGAQMGVNFVMGVGGAFDVLAGKVRRAPAWVQKLGAEWLYRMVQEPGRLFSRYVGTNARFALLLVEARFASAGRQRRVAKSQH
jgi:N-acetylglucosaminyldiphosphoundecaprenol N-acetyl-beta-D-mannosaminyltransferase